MRVTLLMVPLLLCQGAPAIRALTAPASSELSQMVAISSAALPVANPEVIAGAWEIGPPDGIDGIFLSIRTHVCRTSQTNHGHQVKTWTYASTIATRAVKPEDGMRREPTSQRSSMENIFDCGPCPTDPLSM
jgi:hypothetical protein